jgi:hypothetical protein
MRRPATKLGWDKCAGFRRSLGRQASLMMCDRDLSLDLSRRILSRFVCSLDEEQNLEFGHTVKGNFDFLE